MAHSTLHFAFGMTLGSLVAAPRLVRALRKREALSGHFRYWFVASYAAGTFAIVPGVLRRMGASDALCDGWWMNLFLFYPAINALKPGGQTMGPLLMGAILGLQYLALVLALAWRLRLDQRQKVLD